MLTVVLFTVTAK